MIKSVAGLAMLTMATITPAASDTGKAVTLISTEIENGELLIKTRLHAYVPISATTVVTIKRQSRSGSINLVQERGLILKAGESGEVGQSQISFGPGDDLQVSAVVRADNTVISYNTLALHGGTLPAALTGDQN